MPTNLGDLLKQAGFTSSGRDANPTGDQAPATSPTTSTGPRFADKVVLRASRKGRGGKTVTEIQGVLRDPDALARELRKSLGVGTSVEGASVLVQGDQRKRLEAWLVDQGVGRVVVA